MNNLNSILLEGNLVKDPEKHFTKLGTEISNLVIASNRFFKNEESEYSKEVSFFDVRCYGKLAETVNEYLKKGRGIRVIGRLKQERNIDEDGNKKTCIFIIAENIEFKPIPKTE